MYIVFIGPPGSGKGTQAVILAEQLGIPHLSTGAMLRTAHDEGSALGRLAADFLLQGKLVPDDVMVQLVAERLSRRDCQAGCLLDGFPRTLTQAQLLDRYLSERGRQVDLVLELVADEEEVVRRLLRRADLEGRADDTPDTISRRMHVYQRETAPVLDYYDRRSQLMRIDGHGTPEEVAARVQQSVSARRH